MAEHKTRTKKLFSQKEVNTLLVVSLVNALVFFSFFMVTFWRTVQVDSTIIIQYALTVLFSVGIFMFGSTYILKRFAKQKSYLLHYVSYKVGLVVSIVLSFLSYGFVSPAFFGGVDLKIIPRLRNGKIHPGENKREIKNILLQYYVFIFFIIAILDIIALGTNSQTLFYFVIISSYMTFFSLIPVTKSLGLLLYFSDKQGFSRKVYFPFVLFSLLLAIAISFKIYIGVLLAILISIIVWFIIKKKVYSVF